MGVGSCGKKIVYQIIRHWSKLRTRKYDCRIVCSNIFSFRSINNVKVKTITSLLSNKNLLQTHIFSLIINDSDWYCFCREVPGCCRDNLVRDSYLICVLKIDLKKKTIKYLDPVKMWKIFPAWNADLKNICDYDPQKKVVTMQICIYRKGQLQQWTLTCQA